MPCAKAARGTATDALPPFNDQIDDDPCGRQIVLSVDGEDVSADSLCLWHWGMLYGLDAVKGDIVLGA